MIACTDWLFSGILDRHRPIRVAFSEGGAGWVPYLLEQADDHNIDDQTPVVDCLPMIDNRPNLSVLAITHHDRDHSSEFERLIEEVHIDELWVTLRSFVESDDELTDSVRVA